MLDLLDGALDAPRPMRVARLLPCMTRLQVSQHRQRDAQVVLGGPVCIVGSVPDLNVVAVARRRRDDGGGAETRRRRALRDLVARCGDDDATGWDASAGLLFVASADDGREVDVPVEALCAWLTAATGRRVWASDGRSR